MEAMESVIVTVVLSFFFKVRAHPDIRISTCRVGFILAIMKIYFHVRSFLNAGMFVKGALEFNTFRSEQNGHHHEDGILLCDSVIENCCIWLKFRYSSLLKILFTAITLIAGFMGPTWGPSGADRAQMGPMLAPWPLLSGHGSNGPIRTQIFSSWWRHQMETFSALLALCEGNTLVNGWFPSQRPVTRSFDAFFDLLLKKRLNKQWKRRWFETPSRSLSRHCNVSRVSSNMRKIVT